ncbi:uncharacterized protein LOC142777231 [Rhipicephalus microplus]|uniref:uncharacterized protein LOC142777231 n=1 Tax=Rhipicephalus microplus TaxID=6941 RepID=UPI003F6C2B3B
MEPGRTWRLRTWHAAVVNSARAATVVIKVQQGQPVLDIKHRTLRLLPAGLLPLGFFPEQETGFRRHRCTGDSIIDVVATLEDAKSCGDVVMLLLLDVDSAFDDLPHVVVEANLDQLGISGCLRGFVTTFLSGKTFYVRVGG